MAPQLFANGIVNFDQLILFTDPMVTDVCDIPLVKEKGGSHDLTIFVTSYRFDLPSPKAIVATII